MRDRAGQVMPTVMEAGTRVRRGAEDAAAWARPRIDDAAAWARPHVEDARSWAAPRLERSGHAVQETIAPAIADALVAAARKLDVKQSRRRRWAVPAAITMMLAAAASAAAAVIIRRRPAPTIPPADPDSPVDPATGETVIRPDPEVNGRPLES
jgi:hypothetical protein